MTLLSRMMNQTKREAVDMLIFWLRSFRLEQKVSNFKQKLRADTQQGFNSCVFVGNSALNFSRNE
jgi:hypothetical protein